MNPIAFTIGSWPIYWYGILISSALLLGIFVAQHLAKIRGYDVDKLWSVLLLTIPLAIIGARLYYVIFRWDLYADDPAKIIQVWHGGLAVHGGILFGLLAILIGAKIWKVDFFAMLDCITPALALGQAIGRWGNFCNGEAYGGVTSLPWGIHVAADDALHHPTFLYESIWDLLLFFLLIFLFKRQKRTGNIACLYFMIYSVGRFFIEALRTDSLMIGPLKQAQVISVCLFLCAAAVLYFRNRKQPEDPDLSGKKTK